MKKNDYLLADFKEFAFDDTNSTTGGHGISSVTSVNRGVGTYLTPDSKDCQLTEVCDKHTEGDIGNCDNGTDLDDCHPTG